MAAPLQPGGGRSNGAASNSGDSGSDGATGGAEGSSGGAQDEEQAKRTGQAVYDYQHSPEYQKLENQHKTAAAAQDFETCKRLAAQKEAGKDKYLKEHLSESDYNDYKKRCNQK